MGTLTSETIMKEGGIDNRGDMIDRWKKPHAERRGVSGMDSPRGGARQTRKALKPIKGNKEKMSKKVLHGPKKVKRPDLTEPNKWRCRG